MLNNEIRSEPGDVRVGKVSFRVANLTSAADTIIRIAHDASPTPIRLANAYCVALASKRPEYESLMAGPGINYPDGTPVAWFMRRTNRAARTVRGPSVFCEVLSMSRMGSLRHYFVGTNDETLASLTAEIERRYPGVAIAGFHAPEYGPVTEAGLSTITARIRAAEPDIVWVALGTPKQDFAAAKIAEELGIPCVGVGAAFDFVSGSVPEAPAWMQNRGLEWLYRLAREPRRLWRRYTVENLQFLYSVLAHSRQ